ncbi:MAG: alpha/beta hydrolase [Anaeromyxobacter sp.]|nr:alpha/beta hydrolase [Anaeromyxobacter sp.]MBL0275634.1 alpha/beta hydrolase [Anaeromyxobacter sp.]
MKARLLELELDAPSLAGNPLGDPARRPLYALLPPGRDDGAGLPAVYFLHGFTGSARGWLNVSAWSPTVPERIEALWAAGLPHFVAVFLDGFTGLGGTQWTNSPSVGRYQDYLADDATRFVEARLGTLAHREARAVVGKSSGGYGALRLGRDRPEVFGHLACHAGDAGFEWCYGPDLPRAAAGLAGATDAAAWLRGAIARARQSKLAGADHPVLNVLAMAAHYSPDPAEPLGAALPFALPEGRLRPEVWERWLVVDPVRYVPRALAAYRGLGSLFLDCGRRDEFNLHWGARQVAAALRQGGVEHVHEEFDDGHMGINYRYDASLRYLAPRLRQG